VPRTSGFQWCVSPFFRGDRVAISDLVACSVSLGEPLGCEPRSAALFAARSRSRLSPRLINVSRWHGVPLRVVTDCRMSLSRRFLCRFPFHNGASPNSSWLWFARRRPRKCPLARPPLLSPHPARRFSPCPSPTARLHAMKRPGSRTKRSGLNVELRSWAVRLLR